MSAAGTEQQRLLRRAVRVGVTLARHGLEARSVAGGGDAEARRALARRVREAFEELGPTFAKLGQILSTRPDLLPPEVVEELESLQDRVPPLTEGEVVAVMEEEWGVPWEDVLEWIDPEPLAAGTIGQVHRARLESGERVVVKVQRPTAREEIGRDLEILRVFAAKAARRRDLREVTDIPAVVEHLTESLGRELDFRREGENIERMRLVLEPFSRLGVPRVYEALSTSRVLVLEEIQGVPIRDAPAVPERREAARQLLESYYRQVMTEGFFHADPHPGNLLWADGTIYFLDLGMVGEVDHEVRELLLMLLLAFWREDAGFIAQLMLVLAGDESRPEVELAALEADFAEFVGRFRGESLQELQLGAMLEGLVEIASRHGLRLPASLALTGKAFAQMQLATGELDPELDPFSVVGRFLVRDLAGKVRRAADPQALFYDAQKLRLRAFRLVEAFERVIGSRPGPRLQIEFRGPASLEETIRRAARRLAVGLAGGCALIATALAAAADGLATWVPATLGALAAVFLAALAADVLLRR